MLKQTKQDTSRHNTQESKRYSMITPKSYEIKKIGNLTFANFGSSFTTS